MMIKIKHFLSLTTGLILLGGSAHANETNKTKDLQELRPVVSTSQAKDIIYIPLNTNFEVENLPRLERDRQEAYRASYVTKIEYQLPGNIKANVGVVETKTIKRDYITKPASLPRGRYFKPINSALGAKLSSKF